MPNWKEFDNMMARGECALYGVLQQSLSCQQPQTNHSDFIVMSWYVNLHPTPFLI